MRDAWAFPQAWSDTTSPEVTQLPGSVIGNFAAARSDHDMALALQVAEMEERRERIVEQQMISMERRCVAEAHLEVAPAPLQMTERFLADPVWGEVHYLGKGPNRCQVFCFACCPCFVVRCGGGTSRCCGQDQVPISVEEARRAWRRFLLSFASLISFVQVLLFPASLVIGGGFVSLRMNPLIGPHPHTFDMMGAKNAARMLQYGEWWRLLTPMGLHSGMIHLAANVMSQLYYGVLKEVLWGHRLWLYIYLSSGIFSLLASCVCLPDSLGVGSSGAICGLIGADVVFIALTWRQTLPNDLTQRNVTISSLLVTVAVTIALSAAPMIDFAAHAGGLIAGALLALIFFADRMEEQPPVIRHAIQGCSAAALCAMYVGSLTYLVLGIEPDSVLLDLCQPSEC